MNFKRTTSLIFLFLFSFSAFASTEKIASIEIEGTITASKAQILGILPFKTGDTYDPAKINVGTDNLKKWGIFTTIKTETRSTSEGMVVKFILHEGEIISRITIDGNYPYVARKILKRIALQVGELANAKIMEEQKGRITSFYEQMGYYNTKVEILTEPGEELNNIDVTFHIIKGERLRYDLVSFTGIKSFRIGRMASFIKPMDIYTEKRLRTNIREMENFYRDQGYLRVHISVAEKKIDWIRRRVIIRFNVVEGPRMKIFFKGKSPFRISTLKKASEIFTEVNFDTVEMETSAEKLRVFFRDHGYPDAKITFKRVKVKPDLYHITFDINPGARSFVYSIEFDGNREVEDNKLKKEIFSKERSITQKGILDESLLEQDEKLATTYYQSRGFLDAEVEEPEIIKNKTKTRTDLVFPVDEGERVYVGNILFNGNTVNEDKKILKVLKNTTGEPVNQSWLPLDADAVKLFYADNGYPYATVKQTMERDGNKLNITYDIVEGELVKIGEIIIVGDVLSGVRAIHQAMELKSGDTYSYRKILNSQLNLRRMGVFSSANITTIGIDEKETTIHLKVAVEEREPFTFSVEGQYSTDLKYAGTVRFNNVNAFGWGKQTSLLLRGGEKTNRAELTWLDPRLGGSDTQMSIAGFFDYFSNPLETTLQTVGSVSFFRQFHRLGFLTRYEMLRTYNLAGNAVNPQNLRDNTLSKITLSGGFDTRDSFSDPRIGFTSMTRANFFNEIGGLGSNFAILRGAFSHYYTPLKFLTISNTFRIDSIQSIGANISVPQRQLLVLGGDDTVRGFKEDVLGPTDSLGQPVGGKARVIYNGELHLRVVGNFQGALFFDMGSLENSFSLMNSFNLRRSAGFGVRYITPVGPIRADYGIILDPQPGDNFGRLHITFGYMF